MSIKTHDGTNHNGLFDVLGKAFEALTVINTARGTTVPTSVSAFLTEFANITAYLGFADTIEGLSGAVTNWQNGQASLTAQIQSNCQQILQEFVSVDSGLSNPSVVASLQYLIAQMAASGTTGGAVLICLTV